MNSYDDLSIDRLFRLDGDVAFVTGGGDGFRANCINGLCSGRRIGRGD